MRGREVHDDAQGAILLGHHPKGEHWRLGMGGDRKGPAVWPLDTTLARAAEMASGWRWADLKLGVILARRGPV